MRVRYYLSHGTALHLHGLGPSPGALYVTVSQAVALPRLPDLPPVRRVLYPPRRFFGAARLAVGAKAVWISDLERTLIDGLKHPRYSGGVPAVVRALAQRGPSLDIEYLVRQALRLDIDTVKRRLGYLLELTGLLANARSSLQRQDLPQVRRDAATAGQKLVKHQAEVGRQFVAWQAARDRAEMALATAGDRIAGLRADEVIVRWANGELASLEERLERLSRLVQEERFEQVSVDQTLVCGGRHLSRSGFGGHPFEYPRQDRLRRVPVGVGVEVQDDAMAKHAGRDVSHVVRA